VVAEDVDGRDKPGHDNFSLNSVIEYSLVLWRRRKSKLPLYEIKPTLMMSGDSVRRRERAP